MKKLLLAALLCLSFVGLRAQTLDPNYIDGHLYFKFVDSYDFQFRVNEDTRIEPQEMKQYSNLFAQYGVTLITRPLYAFNDPVTERIIRLEFTNYRKIDEFIAALEALPEVEYAERVPLPHLLVTYNDPYSTGSWGSAGPYQWNLSMINAQGAWDAQVASSSIKVAVVDNAVWGSHPDLQISSSNLCSYGSGYAQTGNANPPTSVSQSETCSSNYFYYGNGSCESYDWSHGTHCAGMVAAKNNNGVGISSIGGGDGSSGSGLTLMGVRAANNSGYLYYTSNGVTWAANNGAKVISMSFGGSSSSQSEQRSYTNLYNNGIILVAAAGNEGDGDNYKSYPACYTGVISVASVDYNGKLSYFSQYGTGRADIAAPGGFYNTSRTNNILSTTYCKSQYNRIILGTALQNQYYDGMQGTSMACPTVAGLCGLMLSAYPQMTPAQALNCLQSNEHALASGSNQIDGHGYIDAAASVNCAKSLAAVLRANPSSVVIASRGGSKTVEVTSATNLTGNWTATCNNNAFTISPTSGPGSGATRTMTISADANGTGAPISGTITITQGTGNNRQTATISITQNDQSDFCGTVGDELFSDDSITCIRGNSLLGGITGQRNYEQHQMLFGQRFPNSRVGTVDSLTIASYLNSSTSGSLTIKVYNDNSGVPGSVLGTKTVNMSSFVSAAEGSTSNIYYGEELGVKFDTPVDVSGTYYIVFDFSTVTANSANVYDLFISDVIDNSATQTNFNNGVIYYSGNWYSGSLFGCDYYDIAVSSHFCESTAPWLVVDTNTIIATPLMGSEDIEVSANCDWTVSSSCDWISVSPSSGTDAATVSLSIAENMGDVRNCNITFTYEGGSIVVPVSQMAHQSGCDEAELFDWQHFGWRVNDAHTAYQLDQDSLYYGYAIPEDEDETVDTGYMYGNNRHYNLTAASNLIEVYGTAVINSVTYIYGTTGTGGNVTFKIWDAQKNVLASTTVSMSSLSGSNVYEWELDTPLEVTDSVYVGADFSAVTTGSFFYFYTNLWYANMSNENALNTGYIVQEYEGDEYWVDYYGTIDAFPSICYNGGERNIDMAINFVGSDSTTVISSMTLNPGDTLAPLYKLGNYGEAPYLDITKVFITLDTIELGNFYYPPMNFIAGGYFVSSQQIVAASDLMTLGYQNGDVINLCYRVETTNDTYEWEDADITNNTACLAVTLSCPTVVNTTTETACNSYTLGGTTYTESGVYSDTLTSANGCDSIVTLNLTINHGTFNSQTVTECTNYQWHGTNYTESGVQIYEYTTNNCASADTLHLTILGAPEVTVSGNTTITPGSTTTLTASGADSYVWKNNGATVSTSNPFTTPALNNTTVYTVEGTAGDCTGSTEVTVTVQSAPTTYSEFSDTACGSYTWDLSGQTYYNSGDYDYTIVGGNSQGGDSTITLHLTIYENPTITVSGNTTITSGQSTTLTASGAVSYVWTSGNSTVSTSNPYTTPALNSNTNYTVTGTDAHNCSGSTSVTVIVSSPSTVYDTTWASGCNSYTWAQNGQTYTTSGYHTYAEGNNVHVLSLTIYQNPTISVSGNTSIYIGQTTTLTASGAVSYVWTSNGATVSTSNPYTTPALNSTTMYTVTGSDAHGCSGSTQVTVTVTSAPSSTGDTSAVACDSFTWGLSGQTYYSSGNYTYVTTNANGGDSTVTLHLTINLSSSREETFEDCDVINWNGQSYTQSGTYTVNQTNTAGCPEVVTLHLTVNPSTTESDQQEDCDSFDWDVNGQHYTTSGTYTYTGTNQWGCPRVVTLTLTINHSEVNNIYDTVSAGRAYSNYGFYVPSSETGAAQPGDVIEREHTGLYTVHHCDSAAYLHLTVTEGGQGGQDGIDDVNGIAMKLYPNPASTKVDIDCEGISAVRVYDMAGRMISEQTNLVGDKAQVDVAKFAEGIYVISVMTQSGNVAKQKIAVKH
ncbi:MAG: S8 family serine peptidase [Bacteroidales bacterium]|nr:S8 family serine peptidase [Bacteroidales bacterium]